MTKLESETLDVFINWPCEVCGHKWCDTYVNYDCRIARDFPPHQFVASRGGLTASDIVELSIGLNLHLSRWDDDAHYEGRDANGNLLNWYRFWVQQMIVLQAGSRVCNDYD